MTEQKLRRLGSASPFHNITGLPLRSSILLGSKQNAKSVKFSQNIISLRRHFSSPKVPFSVLTVWEHSLLKETPHKAKNYLWGAEIIFPYLMFKKTSLRTSSRSQDLGFFDPANISNQKIIYDRCHSKQRYEKNIDIGQKRFF